MIPTNNYSSRLGERVRLLALHDTEGARDVVSLGAYFQHIDNASYHGAVDDSKYEAYVNYSFAAWHILNANQESDGLALCGFAAWSRDEWLNHPRMLDLAAAWLAERSNSRNIPLRHLSDQEIRDCMSNRNHPGGIIMHRDYTRATKDGTHTDLGGNFPIDDVIAKARRLAIIHSGRYPKEDNTVELPITTFRIDKQILIDPDNEHRLMLTANTDGEKGTTKVYVVLAVINVDNKTAPKVVKLAENLKDGMIFPQWWPAIYTLPQGTTSVIVSYVSPVGGMVARPLS